MKEPARERHYRRYAIAYADENGWQCVYCGLPLTPDTITADHALAVSKGGSDRYGNIRPSCAPCNSRKSDMPVAVFLAGRSLVRRRDRGQRLPRVQVLNYNTGHFIPIGAQNAKRVTPELMSSGKYVFR